MSDRHFIVPPPSVPRAEPVAEPTRVAAPSAFITMPPTLVDSGTHRGIAPVNVAAPMDPVASETITIRPTIAWRLDLPFGLPSVALSGAAILGRNPSPIEQSPGAALVPIADPAKSISKTHALVQVDGNALWVTDLDSTNGTVLFAPNGDPMALVPGTRSEVVDGSTLALGEFTMRVTRR